VFGVGGSKLTCGICEEEGIGGGGMSDGRVPSPVVGTDALLTGAGDIVAGISRTGSGSTVTGVALTGAGVVETGASTAGTCLTGASAGT